MKALGEVILYETEQSIVSDGFQKRFGQISYLNFIYFESYVVRTIKKHFSIIDLGYQCTIPFYDFGKPIQ